MIERLPELVNADAALVRRGRFMRAEFLVAAGDAPWRVTVEAGRIAVERGPRLLRSWRFAVRASAAAWAEHWRPHPQPGFHDLFAMAKCGEATIEGDLLPLMQNLRYVKEALAAPRRLNG
jgi:hypothetical protein